MYSIVEIGGSQFRVQAGDLIDVEKIEATEGSEVEFDRVLFVAGDSYQVGTPVVSGAKVKAHVIRHALGKKILGARRAPGSYFRRKNHRQPYTALLITEVSGAGKSEKIDKSSDVAKKYLQSASTTKKSVKKTASKKAASKKTVTKKKAASKKTSSKKTATKKK